MEKVELYSKFKKPMNLKLSIYMKKLLFDWFLDQFHKNIKFRSVVVQSVAIRFSTRTKLFGGANKKRGAAQFSIVYLKLYTLYRPSSHTRLSYKYV